MRGYLLTGDAQYIEPYAQSAKGVETHINELHQLLADAPEDSSDFTELSSLIARRISELDLSLQLRRSGNEDAWRFVLSTDVGLKNMEAALPSEMFMRVHRSYIVNLQRIRSYVKGRVFISDSEYVPIGENYREAFQRYIEAHYQNL